MKWPEALHILIRTENEAILWFLLVHYREKGVEILEWKFYRQIWERVKWVKGEIDWAAFQGFQVHVREGNDVDYDDDNWARSREIAVFNLFSGRSDNSVTLLAFLVSFYP